MPRKSLSSQFTDVHTTVARLAAAVVVAAVIIVDLELKLGGKGTDAGGTRARARTRRKKDTHNISGWGGRPTTICNPETRAFNGGTGREWQPRSRLRRSLGRSFRSSAKRSSARGIPIARRGSQGPSHLPPRRRRPRGAAAARSAARLVACPSSASTRRPTRQRSRPRRARPRPAARTRRSSRGRSRART